ncbi:MAG: thiol:disulfide interchange protein [Pseudomonadales bacterium]|nr:thiol:disulfide interchange protein [Pseudomonadales bacterium]
MSSRKQLFQQFYRPRCSGRFRQLALACVTAMTIVLWLAVPEAQAGPAAVTPVVAERPLPVKLEDSKTAPHMQATLLSESRQLVPGQPLQLALRLQPDAGWHTYWRNPGDTGLETRIEWQLPTGFKAGEIAWPVPEWIDYAGLTSFGYHGDTWLLQSVAVPNRDRLVHLPVYDGLRYATLKAQAKWLVCAEVCIPGEAGFELVLPIAAPDTTVAATIRPELRDAFARARAAIPVAVEGAPATYSLGQQLELRVSLQDLPTFNRQPQLFVASKGLAANRQRPAVRIIDGMLVASAEKDPYAADPPHFAAFLLVASGSQGENPAAFELLAEYDERAGTSAAGSRADRKADRKADRNAPSLLNATGTRDVKVSPAATQTPQRDFGLLYILLLALLGGLILNAMPCVFPVLSLKVISLVEHGNHSARQRHRHGLAYSAGVVGSFLVVAGVLIALRSLGQQIGWGFQLQSPWFVAVLVYVLFILGLSLSGVVELGTSLQNIGQGSLRSGTAPDNGDNWHASFFTGVLATIVATPCTAPFMGTAMGFALSQPVYVALLTFAVMGLGLALPFLLVAYVPVLARALPAPGNWMVRLKEVLAFPIYLTVVWLLWVFSKQIGSDAAAVLLVGLVMLALAAWLRRATMYSRHNGLGKVLAGTSAGLAVVLVFTAISMGQVASPAKHADTSRGPANSSNAQDYSPARLQEALVKNKTVFVNMTADWCITCKVNERVALKKEAVQTAFAERNIIYMKGDWTNSDPEITAYLEQFGRNGVPLYVVYKPGQKPAMLPQILTPTMVLEAIN